MKTVTEVRCGEYREDDKSVTLRSSSANVGGGQRHWSSSIGFDSYNLNVTGRVAMTLQAARMDDHHLPIVFVRKENRMLHIVFEYKDAWSNGKWNKQECTMSSVDKCIELYGLGKDCEYRIISIEEVEDV